MRCSCLNSLPFFSHLIVGVGFPPAGQRNLTVLAAGTACRRFSIFSVLVQYGAPVLENDMSLWLESFISLVKRLAGKRGGFRVNDLTFSKSLGPVYTTENCSEASSSWPSRRSLEMNRFVSLCLSTGEEKVFVAPSLPCP